MKGIAWDFFGDPVDRCGLREGLCCLVGVSFVFYDVVGLGSLDEALNILHESHRISEKALIYYSEDIMHTRSRLAEDRDEGVVNMTAALRPAFDMGILDSKSV